MEKCIGCELCAGVCPADCIYVRGADNPQGDPVSPGERYGFVYEINYLRCIHCDLCVEACPTEAITESKLFEFSFTNRADAIYTKKELLVDDEGRPQRLPWEDWREGDDLHTSGWMRATSPSGVAAYEGRVQWSGELGYGVRAPEGGQSDNRDDAADRQSAAARDVLLPSRRHRPAPRPAGDAGRRQPHAGAHGAADAAPGEGPHGAQGGTTDPARGAGPHHVGREPHDDERVVMPSPVLAATTVDALTFAIAAAIVLTGAIGVVVSRNPVHSALMLVMTLFGVAVLFVEQQANFLAAVQVIVYAGAIVVLFLFVIMFLGVDREESLEKEPLRAQRPLAVVLDDPGTGRRCSSWGSGRTGRSGPGRWPGRRATSPGATSPPWAGRCSPPICSRSRSPRRLLVIAVVGAVVLARRPGGALGPPEAELDAPRRRPRPARP